LWHSLCLAGASDWHAIELSEGHDEMENSRQGPGGCAITCLFLVVLLFPVLGSIFLTFMILGDDMSLSEKTLWLVLVWLVPVIGPLMYLLLGQRRNRVLTAYA
jgi:hypothetical protein